jgi:hypothetical protein
MMTLSGIRLFSHGLRKMTSWQFWLQPLPFQHILQKFADNDATIDGFAAVPLPAVEVSVTVPSFPAGSGFFQMIFIVRDLISLLAAAPTESQGQDAAEPPLVPTFGKPRPDQPSERHFSHKCGFYRVARWWVIRISDGKALRIDVLRGFYGVLTWFRPLYG